MSIKRLLATIDKTNLVPMIRQRKEGESLLMRLGQYVCENHDHNEQTMSDWENLIDEGLKIAKFETTGTEYPWHNAANYKSPLITEAVRQFGDRAKMEVMKNDKLVTSNIEGQPTEESQSAADRIVKHMNWQLNREMKGWRESQTRAFYLLAASGAYFRKTYYDATEGCNKSRLIRYPHFSLNNECTDLDYCNFTEKLYFWCNDVWERKQSKIWDIHEDLERHFDVEYHRDERFEFLEQMCCFDLDGDGYEEPLIVTVHKASRHVVRVVARYDEEGIHVWYNGNTFNLADLVESRTQPVTQDPEFNRAYAVKQIEDIEKNASLVRIVPDELLTYYGFIEAIDGTFLGMGYLHIFASPVKGINKTTNALLNSGELANLQGGWLSKEHRDRKSGNYMVRPGHFKITNITASNLQSSFVGLPFKEPSQTLLALNQDMKAELKEMSAKFNADDAMKSGVSAASVLGALQEGIIPTGSLIKNVVMAMSHEFQLLAKLNRKYTEPQIYAMLNGTPDFEADYAQEITITPTANAEQASQMQRITLAQAQLDKLDVFLQIGGNPKPLIQSYYSALGTPNMQELFPEEMTSEEEAQRKEMLETQQAQLKALQQQNQMLQQQLDMAKIDVDRRVFEAQNAAQKDQQELQLKSGKLQSDLQEAQAKLQMQAVELQMKAQQDNAKLREIVASTEEKLARAEKLLAETNQINRGG